MEGSELILGVGEIQSVSAKVVSQNCEDCRLELDADASMFEIVSGSPSARLGSGSFETTVEWDVRAIAAGESALKIYATASGLRQPAMIRVRSHPLPKLED
jgi:hypothetical protein